MRARGVFCAFQPQAAGEKSVPRLAPKVLRVGNGLVLKHVWEVGLPMADFVSTVTVGIIEGQYITHSESNVEGSKIVMSMAASFTVYGLF